MPFRAFGVASDDAARLPRAPTWGCCWFPSVSDAAAQGAVLQNVRVLTVGCGYPCGQRGTRNGGITNAGRAV